MSNIFLARVFFYNEDGSDTLLRNFGAYKIHTAHASTMAFFTGEGGSRVQELASSQAIEAKRFTNSSHFQCRHDVTVQRTAVVQIDCVTR
jgi:hypothetical protein